MLLYIVAVTIALGVGMSQKQKDVVQYKLAYVVMW